MSPKVSKGYKGLEEACLH